MAFAYYYVDLGASGTGHTGAVGDPFSWSDYSTRLLTGGSASPGDWYYLRGSITLSATVAWVIDGTVASPIVHQGVGPNWEDLRGQGRGSDGLLNTTNFPVITNSGAQASGASDYHVLINISWINTGYNGGAVRVGGDSAVYRCKAETQTTGATASGLRLESVSIFAIDCDGTLTGASGGLSAIQTDGASSRIINCRAIQSEANGFTITGEDQMFIGNICGPVGGDAFKVVSTTAGVQPTTLVNCTAYGADEDGSAFSIPNIAFTKIISLVNCLFTGFESGVYNNYTSDLGVWIINSALYNTTNITGVGADWLAVGQIGTVTPTDAESEFVDAAEGDYRLAKTAKCKGVGVLPFIDIGALQRKEPVDRPEMLVIGA